MSLDITAIDFSSVFSQFHEGVLIADKSGVIIYYNSAMGKIDDIGPEYAVGKKILEVYDLNEQQSPTMRCLGSKQPVLNEPMFYRTRLGKVTNGFLNVYPLFTDAKLIGAICFVVEYHMVEEKLFAPQPAKVYQPERKNGTRFTFDDIIGRQTDLSESIRVAKMASESSSPVLIVGETGTGKELFAQSIHNYSPSSENQFVPINCAAIPENLLEGILFGTSKGAFTGSIEKAGLFEQANGGTLFLDELNSMPVSLQTKLLRVIQEKKVRRIGSQKEVDLNLKIISSVNRDPFDEINKGNLRLDLFYRIGVVFIQIPTLRERRQDITLLFNHFIKKFNSRLKRNVRGVSSEVNEFFMHYNWPGNVRELEHVIEGAMNLIGNDEIIEKRHLPNYFLRSVSLDEAGNAYVQPHSSASNEPEPDLCIDLCKKVSAIQDSLQKLDEAHLLAEKTLVKRALSLSKGNVAQAVKVLGLSSPQALQYKMKKHNLTRDEFRHRRP